MAWSRFACLVTEGEVVVEPDIGTLRHAEHLTPRLECRRCREQTGSPGFTRGSMGERLRRWF
jgi:hypothetical protein